MIKKKKISFCKLKKRQIKDYRYYLKEGYIKYLDKNTSDENTSDENTYEYIQHVEKKLEDIKENIEDKEKINSSVNDIIRIININNGNYQLIEGDLNNRIKSLNGYDGKFFLKKEFPLFPGWKDDFFDFIGKDFDLRKIKYDALIIIGDKDNNNIYAISFGNGIGFLNDEDICENFPINIIRKVLSVEDLKNISAIDFSEYPFIKNNKKTTDNKYIPVSRIVDDDIPFLAKKMTGNVTFSGGKCKKLGEFYKKKRDENKKGSEKYEIYSKFVKSNNKDFDILIENGKFLNITSRFESFVDALNVIDRISHIESESKPENISWNNELKELGETKDQEDKFESFLKGFFIDGNIVDGNKLSYIYEKEDEEDKNKIKIVKIDNELFDNLNNDLFKDIFKDIFRKKLSDLPFFGENFNKKFEEKISSIKDKKIKDKKIKIFNLYIKNNVLNKTVSEFVEKNTKIMQPIKVKFDIKFYNPLTFILKNLKISEYDSNNKSISKYTFVYNCCQFFYEDNEYTYLLIDGKWYKFTSEFIQRVFKYVNRIRDFKIKYALDYTKKLRSNGNEKTFSENNYNKIIYENSSGEILNLDCKPYNNNGKITKIEICDWLYYGNNENKFYFICNKIGVSGNGFSHLLNQVRSSSEVVNNEKDGVKNFINKKGGKWVKRLGGKQSLNFENNNVCYVLGIITDKKADKISEKLPFLSCLGLYSLCKDLKSNGIDLKILFIKDVSKYKKTILISGKPHLISI
ncbi:TIGR04141 family sporadically distributed protein [Fructilactobacillus myrtifloralis]|uniref:TIGR04141 family sporadically distributed protein n=1 Tax=Fructilactobacillus myrtifloralis TaxID=2940301 RepID=A0ABY5BQX8_9LACO|nr:DUF6119 family protein [Fructilactobacillus myrtifloralis]USS85591.1 TIGR04141 family sporadically distributed protein [Fructilactobacillus myrtifloralis]